MQRLKHFLLIFSMVSLSNCVFASQDGDGTKDPAISGSVSDAFSKKPVKGVTVYVTAKDGTKLITTDASGKFIIPRLPPGEVTIQLEKKGYKTYRREKVVLKEGMQIKLNFDISNLKEEEDNNDLFHPLLRMIES
jgi:phosphatidate phosphatase APP1